MNLSDKAPIILIVIAIIGTIFIYGLTKSVEDKIAVAYSKKEISSIKLKIYADIDNIFGHSSEKFYASKPVIILKGKGAKDTIDIHSENINSVSAWRNTNAFDTNFSGTQYTITSKISSGCETIEFENNTTNEIFSVLVIIK